MIDDKEIEKILFNGELTEENKQQYFEIYKLKVEAADWISTRRQKSNSFFIYEKLKIIFNNIFKI